MEDLALSSHRRLFAIWSAVQEVLRHMDNRTTLRYVRATDEGKRGAVEAAASRDVKSNPATNLPQAEKATA